MIVKESCRHYASSYLMTKQNLQKKIETAIIRAWLTKRNAKKIYNFHVSSHIFLFSQRQKAKSILLKTEDWLYQKVRSRVGNTSIPSQENNVSRETQEIILQNENFERRNQQLLFDWDLGFLLMSKTFSKYVYLKCNTFFVCYTVLIIGNAVWKKGLLASSNLQMNRAQNFTQMFHVKQYIS